MHSNEPTSHWDRQEQDDYDDERADEDVTQPMSLVELVAGLTLAQKLELSIAMPELVEKFRKEIQ